MSSVIILCTGCNPERPTNHTGTPVRQETVLPVVTNTLQVPGIETPAATAIPTEVSPPVLEHPDMKVVYTREGNLFLWTLDGKVQLTSSGDAYSPKISPDGQVIAYLRPADDFHLELWAIDADGKNERRLVSIADLDTIGGGVRDPNAVAINPYHYEWIPTRSLQEGTPQHVLAFNTQQVFQGPGLSLLDDLNLVNADDLEIRFLLLSGWGGGFSFSPDGEQIAVTDPDSVILCRADGSDYREVLSYEAVNTYSEYRFYVDPVWSIDGAFLRVAVPPKDPLAEPRMPTSLWVIPTDGVPASLVGSVMAVPFFEQPVVFSPDRTRLVYLSEAGAPAENRRELHVAAFDGSEDHIITNETLLHFLGWSVESGKIAFSAGEDQEAWIGSPDSSPMLLAEVSYGVMDLRWVDAKNFLYLQQKKEGFAFYLADFENRAILLDVVPGVMPAFDLAYP